MLQSAVSCHMIGHYLGPLAHFDDHSRRRRPPRAVARPAHRVAAGLLLCHSVAAVASPNHWGGNQRGLLARTEKHDSIMDLGMRLIG
jgi:hypothetical protein